MQIGFKYLGMVLLGFVVTSDGASRAEPEKRELRAAVGVLIPYAYPEPEDGGLLPDAFALLSTRLGEPIRLSRVTYRRMSFLLENGDVDMAIMVRSPASEAIATPIVQLAQSLMIIVGRKDIAFESIGDLDSLRIAATQGGRLDNTLKNHGKLFLTHAFSLSANMLKNGRVDAMGGPAEGVLRALQDAGFGAEDLGSILVLGELDIWLHISRHSPLADNHEALARAAQALVDDGTYFTIRQRYLASDLMEKIYGPAQAKPAR